MSRRLDDLDPGFRGMAVELIARCVEEGIDIRIVGTGRTIEEHRENLASGASWVKRSKHCDGKAIDIVPVCVLGEKLWAPLHPVWGKVGRIGEAVGLAWGGRWKRRDMGHFEAP